MSSVMQRSLAPMLRVLQQRREQERDDPRCRVDDELPRVGFEKTGKEPALPSATVTQFQPSTRQPTLMRPPVADAMRAAMRPLSQRTSHVCASVTPQRCL